MVYTEIFVNVGPSQKEKLEKAKKITLQFKPADILLDKGDKLFITQTQLKKLTSKTKK